MQDSEIETSTKNNEPQPNANDWFLQQLVNMANSGLEFGITLQISGIHISGTMISGKQYFEKFAHLFSNPWPNDSREDIRSQIENLGDIYDDKDDDRTKHQPHFIHLKDANFFEGGKTTLTNDSVLWRGRINEVSGFFLGKVVST